MPRDLPAPFQFDLSDLVSGARRQVKKRVKGVTLSLPFVSFTVAPDDEERSAAQEIVIRMADRRVLNAWECCDDCIDNALASLQEIRSQLVNKQVELKNLSDGSLFLLLEFMIEGIRQFLTFQESLEKLRHGEWPPVEAHSSREQHFAALEMLRAHLHRCLRQVALIADIQIPNISDSMRYDMNWQLEAYVRPELPPNVPDAD